jgi:hypothetical protein
MARFDLDSYETVEERIKRLYELHPDARIITEWENNDRFIFEGTIPQPRVWAFKATIYLSAGDQANLIPKSTGWAVEKEVGSQAEWACELAETSAIGRALANANLSGNKRASRVEMEKVERVAQHATADWLAKLDELSGKEEIRQLYADAMRAGAPKEVLAKISDKGKTAK